MHRRENYIKIEDNCKEAKQNSAFSCMMTVRGSTHMSQTDFAVLFQKWMDLFYQDPHPPAEGHIPRRRTNAGVPQDRPQEVAAWYPYLNGAPAGQEVDSGPAQDRQRVPGAAAQLGAKTSQKRRMERDNEARNVPRDARGGLCLGLRSVWGPGGRTCAPVRRT